MQRILRRRKVLGWILLVLILIVVGSVLFRSPFPPIEIKPEALIDNVFPLGPLGDFDLDNTLISAWIAIGVLTLLSFLVTRRMELIPRGLQNFVEAILEWFLNLVESIAGRENGRRFFPIVASIFFFVLVANWISLVPGFGTIGNVESADEVIEEIIEEQAEDAGISVADAEEQLVAYLHLVEAGGEIPEHLEVGAEIFAELEDVDLQLLDEIGPFRVLPLSLSDQKISASEYLELKERGELSQGKSVGFVVPFFRNANTALNTTLALALVGMFFVEYWGVRSVGFFRYSAKFFNFGRLRRGEIVSGLLDVFVGGLEALSEVARIISFTFRLFGNMFAGEILILVMTFLIPLAVVLPFYGLELFVGFIQAIIFSILTLIFAVIAVAAHGEEAHEEGGETREPAETSTEGIREV
ncbi:MAG: F0F1 ATP synthase subunit A [Dehalococcoidia bacterium]